MSSTGDHHDQLTIPGHYFAEPLHRTSYPAIDSKKANLTGRSVFITGASKGIGKAITVSYAKAGASFIAVGARSNLQFLGQAIQDAAASADRKPPQVLLMNLDVTSQKSVDDAAARVRKEFGRLDILINNAGVIEPPTPIADSDPELWWNTWTINVRGPYLVTRAFLPLLLKGDYKHIVNITSVGAHAIMSGLSAYQPGKLAVLRFTEFINAEYGDKGVLAYAVHPGAIITEIFDSIGSIPEELRDQFQDTPELPADTMVFLTNERRDWLAGRYISCTWDMPELMKKKDEIIKGDKLKVRMVL